MMAQLGPVGIVLSVVFALFITVLFVELWYVWWSRQRRASLRESVAVRGPGLKKQESHCRTWAGSFCSHRETVEGDPRKKWAKRLATWCKGTSAEVTNIVVVQGSCSDEVVEEGGEQQRMAEEEDAEEEDAGSSLGVVWGESRLLFTIREESMEEMQVEEARCSNPAGDCLFGRSGAASPFLTPPSSPPFATPFGSPRGMLFAASSGEDLTSQPIHIPADADSSSSPSLVEPLSDDTSSSSSSTTLASAETPAPPSSSSSSVSSSPDKRGQQRLPLCLVLQEAAYSPSATLLIHNYHTNRVHPLTLSLQGPRNPNPDEPSRQFHLPPLSQPTTPCPFRPSLFAKAGSRDAAYCPALLLQSRLSYHGRK